MTICNVCGVPSDAGFFDRSSIQEAPQNLGDEAVLARFDLHRNYCGELLYFSQYISAAQVATPGFAWEIRINGRCRDPYASFEHIINPWGMAGFPLNIRLDEGAALEFVVRRTAAGAPAPDLQVGGRVLGRYWYNTIYGGKPNPL